MIILLLITFSIIQTRQESAIAVADDKKKKGGKKGGKKKYVNQSTALFEVTRVGQISHVHASELTKEEGLLHLDNNMNRKECEDFQETHNVGKMPPKGYRLQGHPLDSLASRKQNIRLFCNGTTDAGKYALLYIFTSTNILILFIIHSFIDHTFIQRAG